MQFWYHLVTKGIEEQVKSLNFFISSGEYLLNNGVVHSVSTRRKKIVYLHINHDDFCDEIWG